MTAIGGMAKGPSHDNGGIPLVVNSTGRHIELEGDEYVFKKGSLNSTEVLELEGKPWDILKQIAKKYNSSLGELKEIDGGEFVICKKVIYDDKKIKVKGTAQEIVNQLQSDKGCKVSQDEAPDSIASRMKEGGKISISDFDEKEINKWVEMELEHKKTFEALRKNPKLTDKQAAEMVVIEHLEEDKNYYKKYSHGGKVKEGCDCPFNAFYTLFHVEL